MNTLKHPQGLLPKVILLVAAAIAVTMPHLIYAGDSAAGKPNFVFFLIDDMGWTDLGCFGSTFYETPNIDQLARGGMKFTDAYAACPVCSPTRASIMTGKYPARIDLTNWIPGHVNKKMIEAPYIEYMSLEEVTIAEALKQAGYATGFVGKWHLGKDPYYPEHQGFDFNVAGGYHGAVRTFFSPYKLHNITDGPKGEYLTDRLTDESLKFIEANSKKPFLLYLSHYAVHTPIQARKEYIAGYKAKAQNMPPVTSPLFLPEADVKARQIQNHPVYAAMVRSVDDCVGRVMKKLEQLGLADNTIVLFMSDNGGLSTAQGWPTSNVPLRAGKGWLYEGGIREPMIIKWPGVAKPGSVCSQPVISTDFYPTMLEMAHLPLRYGQHKDGKSLVPLLKGAQKLNRKAIFWHYPHYCPQGGRPSAAVRLGDYKLIEYFEDNRVELFNLKKDIGEKNDLAAGMPGKTAELIKLLKNWYKEVDAKMPTPNPDYEPNAQ